MRYDLAVIGGGPAGLAAAFFAGRMGASVVLVEADRVGGDCTWTGCVPSKSLIHAARVVHQARAGGWLGTGNVDFPAVMAGVRNAVHRVSELESSELLRGAGFELVIAPARFRDPWTVEAGDRRLQAGRFIVCTGAEPAAPPIEGLSETPHLTYRTVFELQSLPPRLLVLGGGPTGVELAQAFRRLGSEVVVVEQLNRLIPTADPEASAVVERRFLDEGIELSLGAAVERVESARGKVALMAGGRRHSGDALLVALGRRPRVEGLGLNGVGVRFVRNGIEVDANLRTSLRHVYAAGDVTGAIQFTHYAAWQGYAAARNALFPGRVRGVRSPVPWAVFSDPEVAQVGVREEEARLGGRSVRVHRWPVERIDRAQTEGETTGFLKLITAGEDRLLGATIVSAGAADLANQLAIAMEAGMSLSRLARTIHVYPTLGFGVFQLASAVSLEAAAASRPVRLIRRLTWGR